MKTDMIPQEIIDTRRTNIPRIRLFLKGEIESRIKVTRTDLLALATGIQGAIDGIENLTDLSSSGPVLRELGYTSISDLKEDYERARRRYRI